VNGQPEQQKDVRGKGEAAASQLRIAADDPRLVLLRDQLTFHREEAKHKSESQRTIARIAIAGLAAVAVLRDDIDWDRIAVLLPFAPMLVMALFTYWTAETAFVYRFGRWNAHLEYRINQLLGVRVLTHEMDLWQGRQRIFGRPVWAYALVGLAVTATHIGSTVLLIVSDVYGKDSAVGIAVVLAAIVVNTLWIVYFFRLCVQFNDECLERRIASTFSDISSE
jgi:hypothetical protein